MSLVLPKNLYNVVPRICNSRSVYDKENNFIGTYTGFTSKPNGTSDGHIQISRLEGDFWIRGEGIYIEGMGIKLVSDILYD